MKLILVSFGKICSLLAEEVIFRMEYRFLENNNYSRLNIKMQEMWVWSLSQEDPLEKEMTTHSSILAWIIPQTDKPGRLQSWPYRGSQRVGHDWQNEHTRTHASAEFSKYNILSTVSSKNINNLHVSLITVIFTKTMRTLQEGVFRIWDLLSF